MQNIQNFKAIKPTKKLLRAFAGSDDTPLFLRSECGQDWYECQCLFADNTIKIQYDNSGIIRAVVDKPIPARGNVYAVSMLFPADASVAEVAIEDYPAECSIDGTWIFDGEKVFQDVGVIDKNLLRSNTNKRNRLARTAAVAITTIQASAMIGKGREGDTDALMSLFVYLDRLRDIDASKTSQEWPPAPAILQ